MKKYWWKILGAVILLYTLVAGMLIPLSPGIIQAKPDVVNAGETVEVTVEGYNTNFTKSKNIRAWLKRDTTLFLQSTGSRVIDDNHVAFNFTIPAFIPSNKMIERFAIVVDSDNDGYGILPNKFVIKQDSINTAVAATVWKNANIDNLSERGTTFPFRGLLFETIRNTYYHVPLWFGMLFLFIGAAIQAVKYLRTKNPDHDMRSEAMTSVGLLYGVLGLITGMIWAKHTWGTYWTWEEVKMNMTAIALLLYFAYFVLRFAFDDLEKRARISSVYNLFIFAALIPLIYVVPRLVDSLHPGSGGNPAMGGEDLDSTMRMIFYPAIIGWTLMGFWIATLRYRYKALEEKVLERG